MEGKKGLIVQAITTAPSYLFIHIHEILDIMAIFSISTICIYIIFPKCLICISAQEFMGLCTGNFFPPRISVLVSFIKSLFLWSSQDSLNYVLDLDLYLKYGQFPYDIAGWDCGIFLK